MTCRMAGTPFLGTADRTTSEGLLRPETIEDPMRGIAGLSVVPQPVMLHLQL